MSKKCIKCDGEDITTRHVKNGELINSSSTVSVRNEFITCIEYDFYSKLKAAKEHLHFHCRTCQYDWRENTKDNQVKD